MNFPSRNSVMSAAQTVLTKRSVSCSFSSVFHLRRAGLNEKDFLLVSKMFRFGVIAPILSFASISCVIYLYENRSDNKIV